MLFFHCLKILYHSQLHPYVIFPLFKDTLSLAIVSFSYYYYDPRITSAIRFYIYYFIFIILTSLLKILFLLFYFIIQECHRHSCCEMHIMQCMTYFSVYLCYLQMISTGTFNIFATFRIVSICLPTAAAI